MAEIKKADLISEGALQAPIQLDQSLKKLIKTIDRLILSSRKNNEAIAGARSTTKLKEETRKLISQQQQLVNTQNKVNEAVRKNSQRVKNATGSFKNFTTSVKHLLGAFGVLTGLQAFARLLTNIVTLTKEYEKTNSQLIAVLGVTKSETRELREQQQLLGRTTHFTASEVAQLQVEFAKLGFPIKDIQAMTASTLDAALALGSGLGEQAELTGATLKAYGLPATEAGRVNDVLAKSAAASALSFEKLQTIIPTVAPVARAYGFTLEETIALQGELANSGFDASSAATATRNIFLKLADTNGEFAKSLNKPVKDLPSLIEGLNQLTAEGIDLSGALELTDVRSVAAFQTFLKGTQSIENLNRVLQNSTGAAERMAKVMGDNLAGDVLIAKSAWEGLILSLTEGDGLFNKVSRGVVQFTANLLSLITPVRESTEALYKEKLAVNVLVNSITDLNISNEARNGLLTELQTKYPKFLKNLDTESVTNEQLALRLKDVNEQFARKILLTAAEAKLAESAKEIVDSVDDEIDAVIRLNEVRQEEIELQSKKFKTDADNLKLFGLQSLAKQLEQDIIAAQEKRIKLTEQQTNRLNEYQKAFGIFNNTVNDYFEDEETGNNKVIASVRKLHGERMNISQIEFDLLKISGESRIRIETKFNDAIFRARQNLADKIDAMEQERAGAQYRYFQELKKNMLNQLADTAFRSVNSILFSVLDAQSIALDKQLDDLQRRKDIELQLVGDNEEKKIELQNKFAAEEDKIRNKQRQQDRRKAIFDKASAALQIAINTATAIVKSVAAFPLTGGLPFSAIAGSIGALQLAAVLAQPIPAFAKGVQNFKGGPALVGEAGAELVSTPGGVSLVDKPTLMDLPKGTDVFTNEDTLKMLAMSSLQDGMRDSRRPKYSSDEVKTLKNIEKILKNKKELHINFTRQGVESLFANEAGRTKFLNSFFR